MSVPQIPATLLHVAGPIGADQIQRCTRCSVVLADTRPRTVAQIDANTGPAGQPGYLEGSVIEVGLAWQAMSLSLTARLRENQCMPVSGVLDELTYRSYVANRERCPDIPAALWARVFPQAAQLEARFRDEQIAVPVRQEYR